jgi:diguanylate cyclase (GGDEF)-like protein/PAS domain S-box-containing protein
MTDISILEMEQRLRDSEARLQIIFQSALDGMFLFGQDGRCIDVNPAGCQMTGLMREQILSEDRRPFELLGETGVVEGIPVTGGEQAMVYHLNTPDGRILWVERTCLPLNLSRGRFSLEVLHDVSRAVRAEQALTQAIAALRENEERYMLAASGTLDGLWDWDLVTNRIFFSQRYKTILGYVDGELGDRPEDWFTLVHSDDLVRMKVELSEHILGRSQRFESENRILHKDGYYLWVVMRGLALRDPTGVAYRIAGSLSDVTECKRARMQIDHDALHDALTGLPNRALFLDRLEHALQRCHRRKDPDECFAVLHLDLDRFQTINNSLGHAAGNEVLIAIAQLLKTCVRDVDTVARLAGDEFAILLENVSSAESVRVVADRILESIQTNNMMAGESQVFVSASIGMVVTGTEYRSADEILRDASIARYMAKSKGRGRSVLFTPEMREGVVARLELETDLRMALERQEFCLYYQPILSLSSGKIAGLEALLRWKHPRHGILSPLQFLPIAEETGLIVPIGRWVMQNACQQLAAWHASIPEARDLTVNVNISSIQIHQPDFIEQVDEVLSCSGLDPVYLRLEITETILLERSEFTLNAIDALRKRGIQLHIDDFGTGYSALSYVHNFAIDTVKIDRSFIKGIGEPGSNLEVIRQILKFATSLGLSTVAEGIETEEQLREIQSLPCPYGQGYYISRPLDVEKIESLLVRGLNIPLTATPLR